MSDYNLKYRPQKISELGLVAVRERLASVLKSGEVPHAFLFAGPKGTGKTSAARIIAKAVNCLGREGKRIKEQENFEPCNRCEQCLSITAGRNLDVLEIDAASNRGIDDIRDLREKIKLAPTSARFKVYIIDEAHMLTIEAFNALLKTLEEPPTHAIFILCTTAPEKLPETIVSRCMRFNFKKAAPKEVLSKLQSIVEEEKLEADPVALEEIARAVNGSFRDGLRILEQASFTGEKITPQLVREVLGYTAGLRPENLLEFLREKDASSALGEIARVVSLGGNLRVYTEQLLELLRAGLLSKIGVAELEGATVGEAEKILSGMKIEEIKILIGIFSQAALGLKEAVIPQLPLELAVVEWCGKSGGVGESASPSAGLGEDVEAEVLSSEQSTNPVHQGRKSDQPIPNLEEIQSRWPEVLLGVRPRNYSIEALLRATRPIEFSGRVLTVEVFYQFHKDKLESGKCREIVEEVMSEVFQIPFNLRCVLGERPRNTENTEKIRDYTEAAAAEHGVDYKAVDGHDGHGNGETTDLDIIKVAEEIFGSRAD